MRSDNNGFERDRDSSRKRNVSSSSRDSQRNRRSKDEGGLVLDDNFEIVRTPKKNEKKPKKKSRTVLKVLLSIFLIGVITACVVVGAFLIYVFKFVDVDTGQDLNNLKLEYTSVIYIKDGKNKDGTDKYVEYKQLHGSQNRLWVDYDQMSENLGHAFISAEDKRFETHKGVDWKRTGAALLNEFTNVLGSRQGGSTITQQLIKNITNDNDVSYTRKIREIMRAQYIEKMYSKEVILECYLNTVPLGNGTDGVEVASCYYFDKHAKDLTLTQCAALASITKAPTTYDPYTHPEENKTRRDWVLDEMYDNGYITKEQCEEAKKADLGLRKNPSTVLSSNDTVEEGVNSYFVDALIEDVIDSLVEKKNWDEEYAEAQIYKGGFKIYATMEKSVQTKLEKVFSDDDNFMKVYTDSDKKPQAAITVMDYSGHVVGIIGGRGEKTGNRVLNRAWQSPRQTGSAIKPISAYAPAIEYNLITYGSKMVDEPVAKVNGSQWPVNYTGYYSGTVSILRALQVSMNTIPVKLVQEMGIEKSFNFVTKNMGVTTYYSGQKVNGKTADDRNLSALALGGANYGITTTELTAAYCTFGNGGIYYKPHTFTKILDQYDNVVINASEDKHRAISEETAGVMCKMLQTVTTDGTSTQAKIGDWPIMSKTGTTSDTKDRWFVGCSPYYAASVWFGMDNNDSMRGLYSNPALKLWRAAMVELHEDKELKDFPDSDSVVYIRYCTHTGKVAKTGCPSTAYGYFKKSYMPVCDSHSGEAVEAADKPTPVGETVTSKQNYYDDDDEEEEQEDNEQNTPATTAKPTKKTEPKTTQAETKATTTAAKTEPKTEATKTSPPTENNDETRKTEQPVTE